MALSPALIIFSSLALLLSSCGSRNGSNAGSGTEEAWNALNSPSRFNPNYVTTFAQLPLLGKLESTPWTDSYWPSQRGGISVRWNHSVPEDFRYFPPSRQALMNMTQAQIAQLSPAEKFDILMNRFDYPTVQRERARTRPDNESWEGICHGWAPASLVHQEPRSVTLVGSNRIPVPLASSDIKGLLSYYYAEVNRAGSRMLGGRCYEKFVEKPDSRLLPECRDTNAGTFHLVVTNEIALLKQGFNADVTNDFEVWNQPVFAFESKVFGERSPSRGAAQGTRKEILVETTISYTVEADQQWEHYGEGKQASRNQTYRYSLELDDRGRIIGGEWISEQHPDFLWKRDRAEFKGYYAPIEKILELSTR